MLYRQFKAGMTRRNLGRAVEDIRRGWERRELWTMMASQDTRQRYRRSVIGPFWMTLSMGIFIGALGLLYSVIFAQQLEHYMPYVAAGFIVWGLVSGLILDGGQVFINNEGMIRQLPAPLSLYVFRMVWSNLINFAHNVVIFAVVAVWFQIDAGWRTLLAVPGVLLVALNGLWMGLLLGLISARFRDVPQILASLVQVTFFLTPIIWLPDMLSGRTFVVDWNPIYHLIEMVRAPLLGKVQEAATILRTGMITVSGWAFALAFYTVYRWRIPYWV
jgi:ABC-2 type transport system permease protein/lipopolysaccharide transport system permease protein